ncbi:hypothetical protein LOTGIDRAFT_163073 [Lottia gigantea]|uniref:Phospholipase A2-like domain-containing protein n=1 Tax=Lottia gigantea TaxID=225164 RepID=V4BSQ1_LOTGI|nr:hypothetical protein LOTGIDRAFT_163073 [Lottia gigantea]ESO92069.1 hypothetical protein LOTGIDRAFT_163073 [Lottia gigantea]
MFMIISKSPKTYFGSDIKKSLGSLPGFPWETYSGEKHLLGHNYTGPGTRLDLRLDENDKPKPDEEPVNRVDAAALKHDILYRNKDIKFRHKTDKEMINELGNIPNPTFNDCDRRNCVDLTSAGCFINYNILALGIGIARYLYYSKMSKDTSVMYLGVGTLRQVTLSVLQDVILNLYNIRIKLDKNSTNQEFKSRDELAMTTATDIKAVHDQLRKRLRVVFKQDPNKIELFSNIGQDIFTAKTVRQILDTIFRVCRHAREIVREWKVELKTCIGTVPEDGTGYINFTVEDNLNKMSITWDDQKFSPVFLDTVSLMLQALRDERRQPTPTEYLAIHLAYNSIANGKQLTSKSRPLGSPGFRPHTQTYIALTDPGDGHVLGTTRFNDWMTGAMVHVEYLERPGNLPRPEIETYRVPSLQDFSRVRLHVGSAAPITFYVGRRMKDSGVFGNDFLKVVHMTSATASAAFGQGSAECKIAMEGLKTSEAVRYMRALRCQVLRNRLSQFLSAAWNLNQTVIDDYEKETPVELTERIDIALRAIEITCIGGFDKVTWDGAGDSYPSKCIMHQLDFKEALSIVHAAHLRGLVTYFSAGFKFNDIKHAVYSGTDGIGIGGAQVLRLMDRETGMHGPYMEENIPRILSERDAAADSIRGQGVHLLARMDTMFFEGSLTHEEDAQREKLYTALQNIDEPAIQEVIKQSERIVNLPVENSLSIIGSAERLVETELPLLRSTTTEDERSEWSSFVDRLRSHLDRGLESTIEEEYDGEPWLTFRKKYRERLQSKNIITRQGSFTYSFKTFGGYGTNPGKL